MNQSNRYRKNMLIVGNGIDLKLGYKTSYYDFLFRMDDYKNERIKFEEIDELVENINYAFELVCNYLSDEKLYCDYLISVIKKEKDQKNLSNIDCRDEIRRAIIDKNIYLISLIIEQKNYVIKFPEETPDTFDQLMENYFIDEKECNEKFELRKFVLLKKYINFLYYLAKEYNIDIKWMLKTAKNKKDISEQNKYKIEGILEGNNQVIECNECNEWLLYLRYYALLNKNIKNWCDLEEILKLNCLNDKKIGTDLISSLFLDTIFSNGGNHWIVHKKLNVSGDNSVKYKVFEEFKSKFAKYINDLEEIDNQLEEIDNKSTVTAINEKVQEYDFVLNFNYRNNEGLFTELDIFNVHGKACEKKNIVFGFDDNANRDRLTMEEEEILKKNFSYSKTYQLLENRIEKKKIQFNKIEKVGIFGHSMSEADYSYFYTLHKRNIGIKYEIFYYEYEIINEKTNKIELKSTKSESSESFFKMMKKFEVYEKKEIIHDLIFDERIKFRNIEEV